MPKAPIKITDFRFGAIKKKLQEPYVLSFSIVKEITSLWVCLEDSLARKGIGEAVPLFGYGSENESGIKKDLIQIQNNIIGKSISCAFDEVKKLSVKSPFAASTIGTAIDFLNWQHDLMPFDPIDLVYPITSNSHMKLIKEQIEHGLTKGFHHFKVKVGRNTKHDINTAKYILNNYSEPITFRFDANQAYTFEQCLYFCNELRQHMNPTFLWLEQPLPLDDWEGMEKLCKSSNFPFMLDESIYDENDIRRAKEIGCRAVKLKLFKHPGLEATLHLAKFSASLGLLTTLGNGVSSDIGNLGEAIIINKARDTFIEGSECNGFTRIESPVAFAQLGLNDRGQMIWHDSAKINLTATLSDLLEKSL